MKYVNQLDYPHIRYSTNTTDPADDRMRLGTFARSACGLCACMMALDRLQVGKELSVREALQLAYDTGANRWIGTELKYLAPVFAYEYGLLLEMTNDPEALRNCLRTGGCAIALSGGDREGYTGVFTHGGHYIVVLNEERDGRLAILDPALKDGKFEEEGRKGLVEVKNKICLCSMETLVKDCENRDPGFFLFWRR